MISVLTLESSEDTRAWRDMSRETAVQSQAGRAGKWVGLSKTVLSEHCYDEHITLKLVSTINFIKHLALCQIELST